MDRFGCFIYLFKQKTAYELRISDWSSDGCSSDLRGAAPGTAARRAGWTGASASVPDPPRPPATRPSAGRAGRVRAAGPSRARPRWLRRAGSAAMAVGVAVAAWPGPVGGIDPIGKWQRLSKPGGE